MVKLYDIEVRIILLHFLYGTSTITFHKDYVCCLTYRINDRILRIVKLLLEIILEFLHLGTHLLNLLIVF